MRIKPVFILFLLIFTSSCLDPYFSDIADYVDLPVIEGMISNAPGPYTIRLTHSTALDNMAIMPIRGAVVTIADDLGSHEILAETAPGVYTTSPSGIQGQVGRSYQLTVEFDNKKYQSSFEPIEPPIAIEEITTKIEKRSVSDGYVNGLQFYVNTGDIVNNHTSLMWLFTETYKFRSEYKLDYIYYGVDSIVKNYSDSGRVCWKTLNSEGSYTWTAQNLTGTRLNNFPLQFINTLTDKLSERYSMLLSQFTISETAYSYWNEIEKLQEESGSLYTRQPYQVKGNIEDSDNQDAVVLGYFMAAGVTTKRIFVDRPPLIFNYEVCTPVMNLYQTTNPYQLTYPLYSMEVPDGQAFAGLSCFDCRIKEGYTQEPDFWEE